MGVEVALEVRVLEAVVVGDGDGVGGWMGGGLVG